MSNQVRVMWGDGNYALMEKMKELNLGLTAMPYNSLMTLYTKTSQPERIPAIIQEMKSGDIMPDSYTYNVWMRALAAVNDISGVERVIDEMKRDGRVTADWNTYSNLASIYVDAVQNVKAENALKELDKKNVCKDLSAFQFLITLYGRRYKLAGCSLFRVRLLNKFFSGEGNADKFYFPINGETCLHKEPELSYCYDMMQYYCFKTVSSKTYDLCLYLIS